MWVLIYFQCSRYMICKIFSHLLGYLFILLMAFCVVQKLFNIVPLVYFWFQLQKITSKTYIKNLCFLLGILWFQVFNPFWVNICRWCKIRFHLGSLAYGHPVFPAHLLQRPFPIECFWHPCSRWLTICMRIYLRPLFQSIGLFFCVYASTIWSLFNYSVLLL